MDSFFMQLHMKMSIKLSSFIYIITQSYYYSSRKLVLLYNPSRFNYVLKINSVTEFACIHLKKFLCDFRRKFWLNETF